MSFLPTNCYTILCNTNILFVPTYFDILAISRFSIIQFRCKSCTYGLFLFPSWVKYGWTRSWMNFCLFLSLFLSNILKKEIKMERQANNVRAIGRKFREERNKRWKGSRENIEIRIDRDWVFWRSIILCRPWCHDVMSFSKFENPFSVTRMTNGEQFTGWFFI